MSEGNQLLNGHFMELYTLAKTFTMQPQLMTQTPVPTCRYCGMFNARDILKPIPHSADCLWYRFKMLVEAVEQGQATTE